MKKTAFTLTEILISIGVVGIVAAITAPLISGLIPDKDKIAVLKIYKTIVDTNNEILEDTKWRNYSCNSSKDFVCISASIVNNRVQPDNNSANIPVNSYGAIFSTYVVTAINPNFSNFNSSSSPISFTTKDGNNWQIIMVNNNTANVENGFIITVDLMDEKKQRCVYSDNCTHPGQFSYWVTRNGTVWGNDPLTNAYLTNSKKLNDKKNDYKTARNDNEEYKLPKTE